VLLGVWVLGVGFHHPDTDSDFDFDWPDASKIRIAGGSKARVTANPSEFV
jgi:hypothetical protein